ncbi:MAG: glycosyltransferase family 2 protein [Tenuifilaceae bacterium]|jgi:GT2 family glycosyltransferase|nr:glycosyltransferase family 2 protein [Tenuifilaceae bacterium]
MKSIAIVILNWNGKHYLEQFLSGVVSNSAVPGFKVEIIVADNGSTDGSVQWVKQSFETVRLIELDKNYGFTGGYNRALKQVTTDYYILLNSDIAVPQNWLVPMANFMEDTPNAAACMPKLLNHGKPSEFEYAGAAGGFLDMFGYPFCRGRILNVVEEDRGQYDTIREIFWATGACLMVRATEYWNAGGLDDDFFAHMEEIDLCWRLKRQGYSIWCVPQSVVYHVGGGTLASNSPRKVYFNHRNNLSMLLKNLSRVSLVPVLLFRLVLDGMSAVGYLATGKPKFVISVLRAHLHFYKSCPRIIKKRRAFKNPKISLYRYSILFQFFVMMRRKYSELPTTSR